MHDLERLKSRVSEVCARMGYPAYAWWIPLVMNGLAVLAGLVAVGQRAGTAALPMVAALMGLALVPWLLELAGHPLPWAVHALVTGSAALAVAVLDPREYDFALFVLVMLAGHLGAIARPAPGLLATVLLAGGVQAATMVGESRAGAAFWITALVIGWDVGFVMQYQQRRLEEERRALADHEAQAVLEERQRIAREVHDVIAHSLSVTMLHLTAARRGLEEDGDAEVAEAVEALRDAERLGRQAMTDIRHTVGLLGRGPAVEQPTASAPDVTDVPALVDQFRAAGLDVTLQLHGDGSVLSSATGLGVYRIVQESLTNIAKHQPHGPAGVHLDAHGEKLHLVVSNELVGPAPVQPGGSGVDGMRRRAELLGASFTAGRRGDQWVVELSLPRRGATAERLACPLLQRPGRMRPA